MSTPVVRRVNWWSVVPQIAVFALFWFLWQLIDPERAILFAAITHFVLSVGLRQIVGRYHRQGMNHVKSKNYEAAIEAFEKSYVFFSENEWVDRYRFLTMMSSSQMCYREMALTNIAFCYSQLDKLEQTKVYYERALAEFPNNALAITALEMLEDGEEESTC